MISLLLALAVSASAQHTGQMSPTSDVSGNRVKATGSTTPRALRDRFSDVVNVKDFGAKGDGVTDDTAAIQSAINALCDSAFDAVEAWRWKGKGGKVVIPPGTYRTTDTLYVYTGAVGIEGAGKWSSAIFLDTTAGSEKDVISFARSRAPADKTTSVAGGYGGFIRNVFVGMKTPNTGRHGVYVDVWSSFAMNDVWVENVASTAVWLGNVVIGTFDAVNVTSAGTALRVGRGTNNDYSTTLAFNNFHGVNTSGPGLDGAQCFGCTFVNAVFEGIGSTGCATASACPGVAIGHGEWSFFHPYFEGNKSWDVDIAALNYPTQSPTVTIAGYTGRSQLGQKLNTSASGGWVKSTHYDPGDQRVANGNLYEAEIAGTTASTGWGPDGLTTGLTDGTTSWKYLGQSAGGVIVGPLINGGSMSGAWWLDATPPVRIRSGAKNFAFTGIHYPVSVPNFVAEVGLDAYSGLIVGTNESDARVAYGMPTVSTFSSIGLGSGLPTGNVTITQGTPPATCSLGDVAFNAVSAGYGVDGWRCNGTDNWIALGWRHPVGFAGVAYSASMTPNVDVGDVHRIIATDGNAFTVNAPSGTKVTNHRITITISNTSGGALGAATWDATYKLSAWTQPAAGYQRSITFQWDTANWHEIGRTPADVPN